MLDASAATALDRLIKLSSTGTGLTYKYARHTFLG